MEISHQMAPITNLGPALVVIVFVSILITTIAILLRCYVRTCLQRIFRLDDYLVLGCQGSFYAFMYFVLQEEKYGIGMHVKDIMAINPAYPALAMKVSSI